ncbi:MAG TPA: pitrilysin family protein, partial [Sandaracinaceae bacterium]
VLDPPGGEGLTRLSAQMLRRGPRGTSAEAFDEAIEALGATLGASVSSHAVRFSGTVIRRNLEPFLSLLGRMLSDPGLRAKDLARQKRKNEAELVELRDHDRSLAARAFRRHLFGAHPYGRPVTGTLETVARFTRDEVRACCERIVTTGNLIVGVAGDVEPEVLAPMLERAFAGVPEGPAPRAAVPAPALPPGRRVLVVDKPARTQTQVFVGALGAKVAEPDYHALLVANTGFGGMFTSRLMQSVRVERGWSYGASSKLGADREREAWSVWTHPAATQVLDCLRLELELIEAWVEHGLDEDEIARAKDHLVKSHAFELETAEKRLDPQLETEHYGLPLDWYPRYVERVRAVDAASAACAVRTHVATADLAIALVATATDELLAGLSALPGVRSVVRVDVADV